MRESSNFNLVLPSQQLSIGMEKLTFRTRDQSGQASARDKKHGHTMHGESCARPVLSHELCELSNFNLVLPSQQLSIRRENLTFRTRDQSRLAAGRDFRLGNVTMGHGGRLLAQDYKIRCAS